VLRKASSRHEAGEHRSTSSARVPRAPSGQAISRGDPPVTDAGTSTLSTRSTLADAILDYPQSGERFKGRSTIQAQRGGHPAERHFTVRRIVGGGDLWVSECVITYDGVPTYSLSVMEIADGLVTHETQYFADPFDAPAARAAPAEPIPARD
jgi:hypothetical protein